jgi:hypothetical protein
VASDLDVTTGFDILSLYTEILRGERSATQAEEPHRSPVVVRIERSCQSYDDFAVWCREVVWWGNKKGAYLYGNRTVHRELAGHY